MRETRHPNPLVDTRRPRAGARPGTNPPAFVWRPAPEQTEFRLRVARDRRLTDTVLDIDRLRVPCFLPEDPLPAGTYYWTWSASGPDAARAPVLSFRVTRAAVTLPVPSAVTMLRRLPAQHPRIWVRPEEVAALRDARDGERAGLWAQLRAAAERYLAQAHELAEPPRLPDYHTEHDAWFRAYNQAMMDSRLFLGGAEILALAYLASGDVRYGDAARRRLLSVARWDPGGSTWIEHNDEPHMSIVNWGPYACDWVWDRFAPEERAAITAHMRRRAELAIRFIRSFGHYGATHYGSHHGREIVFLATLCLVFHEEIPEARDWLEWLRPVLCGIWPLWAGDDGAWAEGPHYSTAYVAVMTRFAAALRTGTGIDLFRRPFWSGHLEWRRHAVPAGVEWIGFGDGAKYAPAGDPFSADLVRLLARFTGRDDCERYAQQLGGAAALNVERVDLSYLFPMLYLYPAASPPALAAEAHAPRAAPGRLHRVFPGAGWASLHTAIDVPAADVSLVFRSSPYGSISHSHADHNDFALQVGGKAMLIPSGIYDGWATNHHAHWVWHTKSANCVTLSDAGQIMRSENAVGAIEDAYEDDQLVYWRGNADAAYADRARRCRRHVVFLKAHACFLLVDEFEAKPGVVSALQWNAHAWAPVALDETAPGFRVERDGARVEGRILWHAGGFFSVSADMDPPPLKDGFDQLPFAEHHLRFTPWGLVERCRTLGVLLVPCLPGRPMANVRTGRVDGWETAWLGDDVVRVCPDGRAPDGRSIATASVAGTTYAIGDGIQLCPAAARPSSPGRKRPDHP